MPQGTVFVSMSPWYKNSARPFFNVRFGSRICSLRAVHLPVSRGRGSYRGCWEGGSGRDGAGQRPAGGQRPPGLSAHRVRIPFQWSVCFHSGLESRFRHESEPRERCRVRSGSSGRARAFSGGPARTGPDRHRLRLGFVVGRCAARLSGLERALSSRHVDEVKAGCFCVAAALRFDTGFLRRCQDVESVPRLSVCLSALRSLTFFLSKFFWLF